MSQPFLGMIALFPYNFAPRGWAFCYGQLLPIAQNTALFSLLGTQFGGDGQLTFALPDFRSRVPVGAGQGPGLSNYSVGQAAGTENVTLNVNQMPSHTHAVTLTHDPGLPGLVATANVRSDRGTQQSPVGNVPAVEAAGVTATYSDASPNQAMATGAITISGNATAAPAGGNLPFDNLQPYLGMNFCIATQGIFPSRN